MSIGQSIKKGFGIASGSMGLVALLFAFGFVWNVINILYAPKPEAMTPQLSAIVIAAGVLFILISIYLQGGSLGYVKEKIKKGAATLSQFGEAGGKYYLRLLVIGIVVALVIGVFVLIGALLVAFLGPKNDMAALISAVVLGGVGIYLVILMFLAPYVAVVDDKKALVSIGESISVVRKNLLPLLGLSILLVLIGFVIGLLLGVILGLLSMAVQGTGGQIVFAFLSSLVNAYLGLFVTASFMNFYMGLGNTSAAN